MKKYIVIVNGKVEVDSSALDRAKQYAVEALRGLPDGAQAAIYSHLTTAVQRDVIWKATPNGEAVAPKEKKRTRAGIKCPRWTAEEDKLLRSWLESHDSDSGGVLARHMNDVQLARHILKIASCKAVLGRRTRRAVEYRIGQIRRGLV